MRRNFTPTLQISIGVLSLTISLILVAYSFGLIPNESRTGLEARARISENLAIQLANLAGRNDVASIKDTIDAIISRNSDVRSIAIRGADGKLLVASDQHASAWQERADGKSTATHVQIPLFDGGAQKGRIEITFRELASGGNLLGLSDSMIWFIGFMCSAGFAGYYFVLKRSLRELDPSRAIPERVKAAFNTLAEGVLIIDDREYIILVNDAFVENIYKGSKPLIGANISELPWLQSNKSFATSDLPWRAATAKATPVVGIPMSISNQSGEIRRLIVNATRVIDGSGVVRGVITTFDDVTLLHETNAQLNLSMNQLQRSQARISEQNLQLKFLASNDPLTGCLNRRAFFSETEMLLAAGRSSRLPLSFLMLDADHFKSINDRFGHAVGDKVLVGLVDVMKSVCGSRDLIGRYGGEEFCIAVAGLEERDVERLADQIRLAVANVATWLPGGERVTVSIGIASIIDDRCDISDLTKRADQALYHAKMTGRNRVVSWSRMPPAGGPDQLAERLKIAIQEKKLCCAFQPKVDIKEQRVVGFEALVRWRDDGGDLHLPEEFVGLAADLDLIGAITNSVLDMATRAFAELDAVFGPRTTISINVAAKLVNDLDFMLSFTHLLEASNYANRFILELTEESFIAKGIFQAKIVPILRRIGVRISIDDFGTGYSSLSALADITADEIKIDRSFISEIHHRPRNQSVLQAICSLGRALGMSIVAEGVETYEDVAYLLAATSIRVAQGYYYSRPFYLDDMSSAKKFFLPERPPATNIPGPNFRDYPHQRRSSEYTG